MHIVDARCHADHLPALVVNRHGEVMARIGQELRAPARIHRIVEDLRGDVPQCRGVLRTEHANGNRHDNALLAAALTERLPTPRPYMLHATAWKEYTARWPWLRPRPSLVLRSYGSAGRIPQDARGPPARIGAGSERGAVHEWRGRAVDRDRAARRDGAACGGGGRPSGRPALRAGAHSGCAAGGAGPGDVRAARGRIGAGGVPAGAYGRGRSGAGCAVPLATRSAAGGLRAATRARAGHVSTRPATLRSGPDGRLSPATT